jgi:hypothetical protein
VKIRGEKNRNSLKSGQEYPLTREKSKGNDRRVMC